MEAQRSCRRFGAVLLAMWASAGAGVPSAWGQVPSAYPGHDHPPWSDTEPPRWHDADPRWHDADPHWAEADPGGWYERFDGAAAARHWDDSMRAGRRGAGRPGAGRPGAGEPGSVPVPEPLLFDLVRPLGPRQGEVEFNTLAIFPWRARNRDLTDDPFGPGPSTPDRRDIEWAPEVEWAIVDNFAIEFELPFEGGKLEELKLGLQWTFGTAFDDHYIHGVQVLIEPTPQWRQWNSTLLYLGGIRFDETWSALLMIGGRMDLEGPRNSDSFERLFNASLFADVTEDIVVGVETNFASRIDGRRQVIVVPQTHLEFTERIELQAGVGLGVADSGYELSGIIRGIITN